MNEEMSGILIAIIGILFMVILPLMVGIYLWISGYATAVIVEGIIWLLVIAILRDWLKED